MTQTVVRKGVEYLMPVTALHGIYWVFTHLTSTVRAASVTSVSITYLSGLIFRINWFLVFPLRYSGLAYSDYRFQKWFLTT